jgi:small subunit ribosomal protein S17
MGQSENNRKVRLGSVVSDRADKTIVVKVERRQAHPVYGKMMRLGKNYHVHDPNNDAKIGDTVKIIECRPLSRTKRWRLQEVVTRSTLNIETNA